MKFEDSLQTLYEAQTDMLVDAMYKPKMQVCPECENKFSEEDDIWVFPHACAYSMKKEKGLVCSERCAEYWRETYWNFIKDYEESQI